MSLSLEGAPAARAGRSAEIIASQLLEFLREHEDRPDMDFASSPELMAGGYDTTTVAFELSNPPTSLASGLVLRLFKREDHALRPNFEAAFLNGLADQGFPCPRALIVGSGGDIDGSNFIVMNRAPGSVMGLSFSRLLKIPRVLADIHVRLHEMDTAPVLKLLSEANVPDSIEIIEQDMERMRQNSEEAGKDDLVTAVEWLQAEWRRPDRQVICHGDLHPFNLLELNGEISSVLDWGNSRIGAPEMDVANVATIFRAGPIHIPRGFGPLFAAFIRYSTRRYVGLYAKQRELDRERFNYYRALRSLQALVFEEEAFNGERSQRELRAVVKEVTGLEIS